MNSLGVLWPKERGDAPHPALKIYCPTREAEQVELPPAKEAFPCPEAEPGRPGAGSRLGLRVAGGEQASPRPRPSPSLPARPHSPRPAVPTERTNWSP